MEELSGTIIGLLVERFWRGNVVVNNLSTISPSSEHVSIILEARLRSDIYSITAEILHPVHCSHLVICRCAPTARLA